MEIGKKQTLKIKKIVEFGAYLVDDDNNEVLLPKKFLKKTAQINDKIEVFVYNDSKDRLISTTKEPLITVGEVSILTCVEVNKVGSFLNMGLERDLLLPYAEQNYEVKKGDKVKVIMYVDKSNRLCASMKLKKFDNKIIIDKDTIKEKEYILNAEIVYKIIKTKYKGHLIYTDKNITTEDVKQIFNMSKSNFKKAIGKLLKEDKIKITDMGIYCY